MSNFAELLVDGKKVNLPMVVGSEGEVALDISKLRAETGMVTLDPGFVNTGSCTSAITFLDGEKGILRYRGHAIEDLAKKNSFLEVAYLLLKGDLPDPDAKSAFFAGISKFGGLPQELVNLINSFPRTAHPMAILSSVISSYGAFYERYLNPDPDESLRSEMMYRLLSDTKAIIAQIYRHSTGGGAVPTSKLGEVTYAGDFLRMMFDQEIDEVVAKALDVLLILHADHEQNCSASTVRLVGSSKANLFSSIASGVNALWGPLHGGANQAVIEMLQAIQDAGGDYKNFILKAKDKNDPFRLMGFGHRVYKNFDPRAKIIKSACDDVLSKLGVKDPLLDIAKGLESAALEDPYFVERKLYPNVDFYSGIIYKALGIPTNMFTAMFALGRLPGWLAQWEEMLLADDFRIGRPRQIYVGKTQP